MTSVLDLWRAEDPGARLASGSVELLGRPVRSVSRTRAAPPRLPELAESELLVADLEVIGDGGLDGLEAALAEAGIEPVAVWLVGNPTPDLLPAAGPLPIVVGGGNAASVADGLRGWLDNERDRLAAVAAELRLAGAEAALADPQPAAPAGVLAGRLRRGVAVAVDGALASLHPRPAGRALATAFAGAHARLLGGRSASGGSARRIRDGLWIMERAVGPSASVWLFDDLPFARVDEVGLEALAVTLRALLRRAPGDPAGPREPVRLPPSTGDPMRDTLLAVARANGRIAPAARTLGVHRNTVLYRLRRASAEMGIDPRRPDDALRLLRDEVDDAS
jgi:PucR C-terminal helix-turn-helix domain